MKLAVTGGAGFLGYHICNQLADEYDEILVLDIAPLNEDEYPDNVTYAEVDIRDQETVKEVFTDVDVAVHAAAALPLWTPDEIFSTNVDGTRSVLQAAVDNDLSRVVMVSSTAVYGVPERHPIYEDDKLIGVGPYGEAKIQAEEVCEEFRAGGFCVPIVRPKTFIGTGRMGVFQILYDWVESGCKIPIIGDGTNRYQLLEVTDLVESIRLMLTEPEEIANDTYNVGAVEFDTVNDDVGALCEYADTGARVMPTKSWLVKPFLTLAWHLRISPLYKWVYDTADKDSFVAVDKAREKLGWEPQYSNADALIRSYQWYLDNKEQVQDAEGVTHRVAWKQGIL
ncbi:MAG: NAD-dependent epimerase/dehydratase family protein, partial [Armatimonadota bacterium]